MLKERIERSCPREIHDVRSSNALKQSVYKQREAIKSEENEHGGGEMNKGGQRRISNVMHRAQFKKNHTPRATEHLIDHLDAVSPIRMF